MVERPPLWIQAGLRIPEWALRVEFSRSGGPGGQNVNKVETKVVLCFAPEHAGVFSPEQLGRLRRRLATRLTRSGELRITATRHRSQERNLLEARERLAEVLRAALVVEPKRTTTRPTRGSVRRRLEAKSRRASTKQRRRGKEDE